MFSGLVQEVGAVQENRGRTLTVVSRKDNHRLGDSVAVNGVCLTVAQKARRTGGTRLRFDLSRETLRRTTLGNLKTGEAVNIERALTARDALGGHIVQGHVDGVGKVSRIRPRGSGRDLWIKAPA